MAFLVAFIAPHVAQPLFPFGPFVFVSFVLTHRFLIVVNTLVSVTVISAVSFT